jgi:hypothetical protein
LSAIETDAVLLPVAFGRNVARTLQLAFTASEPEQVVVIPKSAGLVPVRLTALKKYSVPGPTFVNVTVCAALVLPTFVVAKLKLEADNFTCVPMPLKLIICGLAPPLSAIDTEAVRVPGCLGWNVRVTVQLAFAPSVPPHVFDNRKSPWFVPVTLMLLMLNVVVPTLVSVTDCTELLVL